MQDYEGCGWFRTHFPYNGGERGILHFDGVGGCAKVFINGKKTFNVNMNRPRVEISDLLRIGENEIVIEYSSNLNHLQLSRGAIREGVMPSDFLSYETKYESYGPRKATLCPYSRKK